MSLAFLILGGNRGNRTEIFSGAIKLLTSEIGVITATSSCYESESWGFESENFLNQVIAIETSFPPHQLLERLLQIEAQLGRTRHGSGYEARTLDIDLLYYDDQLISTADLVVPHPRIAMRRFVLVPLAEIAPNLTDPVTGMTVGELLQRCTDPSKVWRYDGK